MSDLLIIFLLICPIQVYIKSRKKPTVQYLGIIFFVFNFMVFQSNLGLFFSSLTSLSMIIYYSFIIQLGCYSHIFLSSFHILFDLNDLFFESHTCLHEDLRILCSFD